jgi:hypothetical protein
MSKIFFGLVLVLGLFGCKETETDKVADAQFCIDQATATNVNECVTKIVGIETRAAYVIRCTAKFVEQSYTEGDRIFSALKNLDNGDSGNQSAAVMAALAFTAAGTTAGGWTTNLANAELAVSLCKQADLKALINIASYATIATVAGQLAGAITPNADGSISQSQLQTALASASGNPAAQTAIGNAALTSYQENCTDTGTGEAPGEFCTQFDAAIDQAGGQSNPQAIGAIIAQCYANPAQAGCEAFR